MRRHDLGELVAMLEVLGSRRNGNLMMRLSFVLMMPLVLFALIASGLLS